MFNLISFLCLQLMDSGLSGAHLEAVPRLVEEVLNTELENVTILPQPMEDETAKGGLFNPLPATSRIVQVK